MKNKSIFLSAIFLILGSMLAFSQASEIRQNYIDQYSDLAVSEMKKSGIPASITMAQALLESDNGQSDLALTANNHFGIKCHKTWDGKRFYYDDDNINDCFRAYKRVEESYRDHSLFLMNRDRYNELFDFNPTDYKAWAKGLKNAGYATNPRYADLLIKIIEDNDLYKLDHGIPNSKRRKEFDPVITSTKNLPSIIIPHTIYTKNRIKFVVAEKDDHIKRITDEYDKFRWEIRRYNEIPKHGNLKSGQIVYLQPKRKKAARGFDIHHVSQGETWYSISQHYGIKLKWLYKRNNAQPGTPVIPGDTLFLRGKKSKGN